MKKFILLLVLLHSTFSFAKEASVWGKLIKSNTAKSEYYILLKRNNEDHIFPVKASGKNVNLAKHVGQFVQLNGPTNLNPLSGHEGKFILMLEVKSVKTLDLAQLRNKSEFEKNPLNIEPSTYRHMKTATPTLGGLSDKAVNAIIFTGAALLATDILVHGTK